MILFCHRDDGGSLQTGQDLSLWQGCIKSPQLRHLSAGLHMSKMLCPELCRFRQLCEGSQLSVHASSGDAGTRGIKYWKIIKTLMMWQVWVTWNKQGRDCSSACETSALTATGKLPLYFIRWWIPCHTLCESLSSRCVSTFLLTLTLLDASLVIRSYCTLQSSVMWFKGRVWGLSRVPSPLRQSKVLG